MADSQKELLSLDKIVIKATARSEKPKRVRRAGFIPGVLNGPGTASASVQFESAALNRIIETYGTAVKLWIDINGDKKYGFVKEIQRNPVEGKIIHVAVQLVSEDQNVKLQLPIVFQGEAALQQNLLHLQIDKSDIEVEGKTASIPDKASIDVSKKQHGDSVTAADFRLPDGVKILDAQNTIYATVKGTKKAIVEQTEEQ